MLMNEPRINSVRQVKDPMLKAKGSDTLSFLPEVCQSAFRRQLMKVTLARGVHVAMLQICWDFGSFCVVKSSHLLLDASWELLSATSVHPTQVDLICSNFLVIIRIDMERTFLSSLLS